jgi:hypothetical protein
MTMVNTKLITANLYDVCMEDNIDKYMKYMVDMKDQHVSLTNPTLLAFFQCCKNSKIELTKYIYEQDVNSDDPQITHHIIYKELKYAYLNKNSDIYNWISSLDKKFSYENVRNIFVALCKINMLDEIKSLYQKHDFDVHGNNNSMLHYCFKYGYIRLAQWIRLRPVFISSNMINTCCINGNLEMVKYFTSINRTTMTYEIIENCCSENQYDIFIYLCEEYKMKECFHRFFKIACLKNFRSICEFLINKTAIKSDLIKYNTLIRFDSDILTWLLKDHIDIFEKSYNYIFDLICDKQSNLPHIKTLLNKYEIVVKNNTCSHYDNTILNYLIKDHIEIFNTNYSKVYIECCRKGYIDNMKLLIDKYNTILEEHKYAICDNYHDDAIIYLIDNHITAFVTIHNEILKKCCNKNFYVQVKKLLNEYTFDLPIIEEYFVHACCRGNLELMIVIYDVYPSIDLVKNDNYMFRRACYNVHTSVCDWLCSHVPTYGYIPGEYQHKVIYKIATIDSDEIIDERCCVCMDDTNCKTNCNHIVCTTCVNQLIDKKCPICRRIIEYCFKSSKRKREDSIES